MGLFFSAEAIPKSGSTAMEDLQKQIAAMKDADRIRRKYGANLADDEIATYLEKERIRAIEEAEQEEAKERNRLLQIQRDKEIREFAVAKVREGRLVVAVDGVRLTEINTDLAVNCSCGHALSEITNAVLTIAKEWYDTPAERMWGGFSPFLIPNLRNPYSFYQMILCYCTCEKCPGCKESKNVFAQVVLV